MMRRSLSMNVLKVAMSVAAALGVCALTVLPAAGVTQKAANDSSSPEAQRDGAHDFDFDFGVWHTEITRRLHPLSDSTESMKLSGTVTIRRVWGGKAQLEEIEADGPKGHWEGMSLFLYDPGSHQWSQSFINSRMASLGSPLIGSFKDGRGELFSQDTFHNNSILVRAVC